MASMQLQLSSLYLLLVLGPRLSLRFLNVRLIGSSCLDRVFIFLSYCFIEHAMKINKVSPLLITTVLHLLGRSCSRFPELGRPHVEEVSDRPIEVFKLCRTFLSQEAFRERTGGNLRENIPGEYG